MEKDDEMKSGFRISETAFFREAAKNYGPVEAAHDGYATSSAFENFLKALRPDPG